MQGRLKGVTENPNPWFLFVVGGQFGPEVQNFFDEFMKIFHLDKLINSKVSEGQEESNGGKKKDFYL